MTAAKYEFAGFRADLAPNLTDSASAFGDPIAKKCHNNINLSCRVRICISLALNMLLPKTGNHTREQRVWVGNGLSAIHKKVHEKIVNLGGGGGRGGPDPPGTRIP